MDESCFGGVAKGRRGRGARGKVPVLGLLKRGGKGHAVVIPNARSETLFAIIREKIKPDGIVRSDSLRAYDVPDMSGFRHVRINHSGTFVDERNHINGIGNFRNRARRRLRRFNGVPRQHLRLYLKEREWRFNHGPTENLLKVLRKWANVRAENIR